jgi:polysaccharide biosynthesis/export protein ExoF
MINPARTCRALLCAASWLAAGLFPQSGFADPYRLGAYDKVNIRVVEWRQGEATYKDWEVLTGLYAISGGMISVPLAGEFAVEGKTTAELEKEIADSLQKHTGLMSAPSVSISVENYGMVYVMGDVQNPGEFPYSPNMTVLQAVSSAGGFFRKADAAFMRLDRDRIASAGDLEAAQLDHARLLVRQARLEAELRGESDFDIPAELRENQNAAGIAGEERGFMKDRRSVLESKLATLTDLQALSEQQIDTLGDKIKSQHVQIQLANDELKGVTTLYKKGLAVSARQMSLQRELADAESKLLDLEIALVQSKQAQKQAERDKEDLKSTEIADIQKDLQDVRPKLEHAKVEMRTAELLIREATITAPALLAAREKDVNPEPIFTIAREASGSAREIKADASTRLRPKDVIEVSIDDEAVPKSQIPSVDAAPSR